MVGRAGRTGRTLLALTAARFGKPAGAAGLLAGVLLLALALALAAGGAPAGLYVVLSLGLLVASLLVCGAAALAETRSRKAAVRALLWSPTADGVGELATALVRQMGRLGAVVTPDVRSAWPDTALALHRCVAELTPEGYAHLTERQRLHLCRVLQLCALGYVDLALAVVGALGRCASAEALPYLARLSFRDGGSGADGRVLAAADVAAHAIRRRLAEAAGGEALLRPADPPPDTLLRPAARVDHSSPADLLRPAEHETADGKSGSAAVAGETRP